MSPFVEIPPSGIVAFNLEGRILWSNPKARDLFGPACSAGAGYGELGATVTAVVAAAMSSQRVQQSLLRSPGGALLQVEVIPEVGGFSIQAYDHAELLPWQERQKRRTVEEITHALSWDVRTPVSTLQAMGDLLLERVSDPIFLARFQVVLQRELQRLGELPQRLPALLEPQLQTSFQIPALLAHLQGSLLAHPSVAISAEDELPSLAGELPLLAEALLLLLANSRDATGATPHSEVRLRVRRAGVGSHVPAVMFSIEDDRPTRQCGTFLDNSTLSSPEVRDQADARLSRVHHIVREFAGELSFVSTHTGVAVKLLIPALVHETTADY